MTDIRPINLIKVVARLLISGVDSQVIMDALIYGGLPGELAIKCLELTKEKEVDRLTKLCENSINQIKQDIERLLKEIS